VDHSAHGIRPVALQLLPSQRLVEAGWLCIGFGCDVLASLSAMPFTRILA
jgi:hypothetical protein